MLARHVSLSLRPSKLYNSAYTGRIFMKICSDYILKISRETSSFINPLTPNDPYSARTAPLTSKVAFYIFIQQI